MLLLLAALLLSACGETAASPCPEPTAAAAPSPAPSPTPTPTPSAAPSPMPTPVPTPSPLPSPSLTPAPVPAPGEDFLPCEDGLWWKLEDGTLTIAGAGAMADYRAAHALSPWLTQSEPIRALVVVEGVTSIGAYAFYATMTSAVCRTGSSRPSICRRWRCRRTMRRAA